MKYQRTPSVRLAAAILCGAIAAMRATPAVFGAAADVPQSPEDTEAASRASQLDGRSEAVARDDCYRAVVAGGPVNACTAPAGSAPDPVLLANRAILLVVNDDPEAAIAAADAALQAVTPATSPELRAALWNNRGAIAHRLNRLDDAIADCDQALAMGGDTVAVALANRAISRAALGDPAGAEADRAAARALIGSPPFTPTVQGRQGRLTPDNGGPPPSNR